MGKRDRGQRKKGQVMGSRLPIPSHEEIRVTPLESQKQDTLDEKKQGNTRWKRELPLPVLGRKERREGRY